MSIERPDWAPPTTSARETAGDADASARPDIPESTVTPEAAPTEAPGPTRIDRPNWGPMPSTRPDLEQPPVAEASAEKPTFSQEDLAELNVEQEADDEGEDETLAFARKALASGHLGIDEVKRLYALTDEEVEAIKKPPAARPAKARSDDPESPAEQKVTVGTLKRELKEIEAKRLTDRDGYFRDEKLQARERELIAALDEALKARAAEPKVPVAELGLPKKLLENWDETGGIEHNLEAARESGQAALDDLDEAEQAELSASVDALPPAVQTDLYGFLSIDAGKWRAAREDEVQRFAALPEGAELIAEWGDKAAQKIGNVQARISMIEERMSPEDRAKAQDWIHNLPPSQLKSVLRSIAGR